MTPQIIVDEVSPTSVAGDLDRVAFVEWLYAQDAATWTAQAESVSHNPLALWFAAQGYCLVQTGFAWAWLNFGTVDETWLDLGDWGEAFLTACVAVADRVGRNELTRAEVLLAVLDADWACQTTMILDRKKLPAA